MLQLTYKHKFLFPDKINSLKKPKISAYKKNLNLLTCALSSTNTKIYIYIYILEDLTSILRLYPNTNTKENIFFSVGNLSPFLNKNNKFWHFSFLTESQELGTLSNYHFSCLGTWILGCLSHPKKLCDLLSIELRRMEWWNDGIMEWWNDGMMEWWKDGMKEWWNDGMLEWLNGGMMEWWNYGIMEWWNGGMMEAWNVGMMECRNGGM